jgi:tetratricopeptide (TPR) repeat protein
MKRLTCHFLFWWGAVCLAPAGLADISNTNSLNASGIKASPVANPVPAALTNQPPKNAEIQSKIELARDQQRQKNLAAAAQTLESILKTNAPPEMQRVALFELALVTQDDNQLVKAQQILAQYLHLYPEDPTIPDILLRQGLLYRQMGVNTMAVSKFYAVMSSALKLKLDNIEYYKKLVVQAQTDIAETYFLEAKFAEAAEYFSRILKAGEADLNREPLECSLIRSLSYLTNQVETIGKAQAFLERYPQSSDVPEVRFLLAAALKGVGRNQDSMRQVLLLLQSQQENVSKNPETWFYWQRRAGNEIANQLYKEGDYVDALEIYLTLAELDKSPAWQVPVWYQVGMVYEQLQQWQKATDTYTQIMDRQKDFNEFNSTPILTSLVDMAKWRKDYIAWMQKARASNLALLSLQPFNAPRMGSPLK